VPKSLWPAIRESAQAQLAEIKMGSVEDFTNFVNAVIDEKSYDKITSYIEAAKADPNVSVEFGGTHSKETGYFIQPTLLRAEDPKYVTMCEELFGPVVTLFVYEDNHFEQTLKLVDETSPYALTGSIFARDRSVIRTALDTLVDAAGNFYINDKPTGAVVGQQPFGGARASGTNDKAGSYLNLVRWVSARTIKENFNPPTHFGYPYLLPD
jgi:1-pyrroline-5-carboxylate dehydrogenase